MKQPYTRRNKFSCWRFLYELLQESFLLSCNSYYLDACQHVHLKLLNNAVIAQQERYISLYNSMLFVILSKYSQGGRFYEMASVWIHVKWWRGKWEDIPCVNNQFLGQILAGAKQICPFFCFVACFLCEWIHCIMCICKWW